MFVSVRNFWIFLLCDFSCAGAGLLLAFFHVQTKFHVGKELQFIRTRRGGHLKVGEVAVETAEARLAPGIEQLYSGVQYNSTEPHQLLARCSVYNIVQLGLSHNNFLKCTGRKQSRMDRFENKSNCTPLIAAQVYSVVQLGLGHGHTHQPCHTPLHSHLLLN